MLSMAGLAFVQMIGRYLVKANFLWADEVTVFCLTFMIAFCAPMLWIDHDNINMDLFGSKLSPKVDFAWMCAIDGISLAAALLLVYSSVQAALLHRGFVSSYLGYDESVRYLFVIVFSVLLSVTTFLTLVERLILHKQGGGKQNA